MNEMGRMYYREYSMGAARAGSAVKSPRPSATGNFILKIEIEIQSKKTKKTKGSDEIGKKLLKMLMLMKWKCWFDDERR